MERDRQVSGVTGETPSKQLQQAGAAILVSGL